MDDTFAAAMFSEYKLHCWNLFCEFMDDCEVIASMCSRDDVFDQNEQGFIMWIARLKWLATMENEREQELGSMMNAMKKEQIQLFLDAECDAGYQIELQRYNFMVQLHNAFMKRYKPNRC